MKKNKIIKGQKFNRLTVIKEVKTNKPNRRALFICECGNKIVTTYSEVKNGHSKSCGCYAREQTSKRSFKHGLSSHKFNDIFYKIKSRCHRKKDKDYNLYGGRGIECKWKNFIEFRDDMYTSYLNHKKKHTGTNTRIERIDNNGHYCKKNCKWATHKEQARNRRSNNLITYNGETKTLVEWSEALGIKYQTLSGRINNYKWTIKRSFETNANNKKAQKFRSQIHH